MADVIARPDTLRPLVENAARELVRVNHMDDVSLLSLPMVFPDGSSVTVRIYRVDGGIRVSDNGVAYRQLECIGAHGSFSRTVKTLAEADNVKWNTRVVYVDVPDDQLVSAICDVGAVSWATVMRVYSRVEEQDEDDIEDYLKERLITIFGADKVRPDYELVGSSTTTWKLSAVVQAGDTQVAFQAVSNHANSVFRTSSAFHDLALVDHPPARVAVVRDKRALGAKLSLLTQAGRVIQDIQPDDTYRRAAV